MAPSQNITLSIPHDVLRRVERLAAERGTSVSALMAEALTRLMDEDHRDAVARIRALAAMELHGLLGRRASARGAVTSCTSAEASRRAQERRSLLESAL